MTRVGNLGEKFAIKIIYDFLSIKSSMCDASTQSRRLTGSCLKSVNMCLPPALPLNLIGDKAEQEQSESANSAKDATGAPPGE